MRRIDFIELFEKRFPRTVCKVIADLHRIVTMPSDAQVRVVSTDRTGPNGVFIVEGDLSERISDRVRCASLNQSVGKSSSGSA
jgi:hypothetical protein